MFKNTLNLLQQLNGQQLILDIEQDEDGYIDRECPAENCKFQFKVLQEDWVNLFKDEAIFCPMCRHESTSGQWATSEQVEDAQEQAHQFILSQFGRALRRDAANFNASQNRRSFLQMSMSINGLNNYFYKRPIPAMEEMALKISCDNCGARFAVIGSAFFCPCCGHNSAEQTINASLNKVEVKINSLGLIRKTFVEQGMKDEAEITLRSLLESCLGDCLVAFQRYCEQIYLTKTPNAHIKQNVFQRIDDGSKLWVLLVGEGYVDWLDEVEMARLNIYFQQRHLFAHSEGIVDETYIKKTGDTTYREGQRVVVKENDAKEFLSLIRKLVDAIRTKTEHT